MQWFRQVRGASALVNGTDSRIGLAVPPARYSFDDGIREAALYMRGFVRVSGEIPGVTLARCFDDEGRALGYDVVGGSGLIENPDQRDAFEALSTEFSTRDAKRAYGQRVRIDRSLFKEVR